MKKKIDRRTWKAHLFVLVEFCRVTSDVAAFLEVSFLNLAFVEQTKIKLLFYVSVKTQR